ncbi:cytochrome P450 [Kibdelosporangium persicum]|uniref:Pentalenic acid synthase n=1 Tax=Kibdelosporangium persicum TaxID=2698649 RepID=A0ABX2FFJ6_9PSEU|nr:cytochrome P450 [Kibdelosporangium persicum]NRN69601.1 Pentalenic acid synthase [Kibdelosporangium persicum]
MSSHSDEAPALFGPEFDRNPAAALQWLRENAPVYRLAFPGGAWAWFVTRYDDAVAALADPRLAKNPRKGNVEWQRSGMGLPLDHRASLVRNMVNTDPPDHARLRRAVRGAFTPRRMEQLRVRTQQVTDELLAAILRKDTADLIEDLAYPLPITILCDLLGVPEQDRAELHRWAKVIDSSDDTAVHSVLEATDALEALVVKVVAGKRRDPAEDLISELIAQQQAGTLSADELTSTVFLLLIGGHETTVALIGNALLALLTHPRYADAARADAGLLPAIIEESLRLDPPTRNATWRFVTEPMTLAGQPVNPGDAVLISLLSANRDPGVFADPDTFQPRERDHRHLAFGHGPHVCIGAAMARMEATAAIGTVLRTLPNMRLAVPAEELVWWPSPIMRGLYALPVHPTPS